MAGSLTRKESERYLKRERSLSNNGRRAVGVEEPERFATVVGDFVLAHPK